MLLQNVGLSHVRTKALSEYRDLIRSAFREFVNQRILQRLDLPSKDKELEKQAIMVPEAIASDLNIKPDDGIITTESELKVFEYTNRRLAFLVKDDKLFEEIDKIEHKDYKGKFVVFYKKERAGRLFDFYDVPGADYHFDFGQAGGEIVAQKLSQIDPLLIAVFSKRVEEMEPQPKRRDVALPRMDSAS